MSLQPVAMVGSVVGAGLIATTPQDWVRIENQLVAVKGATVTPHGTGPHAAAVVTAATGLPRIGGLAMVRATDRATCTDAVSVPGAPFVRSEE